MTKTAETTNTIAERIRALTAELEQAEADCALAERLAAAPALAKRLRAEIERDRLAFAKANAAEHKSAQDQKFACFNGIRIEPSYPNGQTRSLLSARFTVIYSRDAYDPSERRNFPREHRVNGIFCLPDDVYEYLVECRPDAIPAEIRALDPSSPSEALFQYHVALQRGYMTTVAV